MRDEKAKFHETVGILVEAYMSETLVHGHPCGCAVGNLVAKKLNINIIDKGDRIGSENRWVPGWDAQSGFSWFRKIYPERETITLGTEAEGNDQIYATGYSAEEIRSIECAFESVVVTGSPSGSYKGHDYKLDKDGYEGLMAVVDVLAEIHGIDLTEKEEAKLLFVK